MNSYINFADIGEVFAYSLLAVIVVVGAFSVGALSLARGEGARAAARPAVGYLATAWFCFVVSAVGVGVGVWFILDK